jgi:ABC-type glycerol-3-phosphate transport system permease component
MAEIASDSATAAAGRPPRPAEFRGAGLNWLPHLVLWLGIAVTAFPLYIAFVASTLTPQDVAQAPMPALPGAHMVQNYQAILIQGMKGTYLSPPVWQMMWNSLLMALIITAGKVVLSMMSAYAVVFFDFRGRDGVEGATVAHFSLMKTPANKVHDIVGGSSRRFVDQEKAVQLRGHGKRICLA